jgi:hypothetical protein
VADAQAKLLKWQRDYNEVRPHNSLGQIPPREFVAAWQLTRTARGEILNLETVANAHAIREEAFALGERVAGGPSRARLGRDTCGAPQIISTAS